MKRPVAIFAPAGRDLAVVLEILRADEINCRPVDASSLVSGIAASAYSAVLLTEEALAMISPDGIRTALDAQPPWSDLPFVVLTSKGHARNERASMLTVLGNVVEVRRPVHPTALIALVRNALRGRKRQVEASIYLREREQAEIKLQEFAEGLERQITYRTRALTAANLRLAAQNKERVESQERLSQMQAELIHVSRVSAMGTMASTLAHELNQPLTAVSNYLRGSIRLLAVGDAQPEPAIIEGLESAAESAMRAGEIVRRLRDLVSRGTVSRKPEDLFTLVCEAVAVGLVDAVAIGMRYTNLISPEIGQVLVDRIQIQQVLINLLRNAVQAMGQEGDGRIVLSARIVGADMAEISVADTGPGLTPDTLARLFTPFQTTKEDGMGVGLSICRTIVEANGGIITGENGAGGGAVFRFTLPLALERTDEATAFRRDAP